MSKHRRRVAKWRRTGASHLPRPQSEGNPYEGPQADGWDAFMGGKPRRANPYHERSGTGKGARWDAGWVKAKLAVEQGKAAL